MEWNIWSHDYIQEIGNDYLQEIKNKKVSKRQIQEQWEMKVTLSSIKSPSEDEQFAFLCKLWREFELASFESSDRSLKSADSGDKMVLKFQLQGLNPQAKKNFDCDQNCRCGNIWRDLCTEKISKE